MNNDLRTAMQQARCSSNFINYAIFLLRFKEIDWADWATSITTHEITVRLMDGYTIRIND